MDFIEHVKLNLAFDFVRLQHDLAQATTWAAHGNVTIYSGNWSGLALRNTTGSVDDLAADTLRAGKFVDTGFLQQCTYIPQVIEMLACPIGSVRFLKLAAGAVIDEHIDGGLCYEFGEARLHIPVVTNPQLEFMLNGQRLSMGEGECWYINANMPHAVANRGSTDRVHLVIDVGVNEWVQAAFESALGKAAPVVLKEHFGSAL